MADTDKRYARHLFGKMVVSKTGKRFGEVGNLIFEEKTGELLHLVLRNPTSFTESLDLERDEIGNILIPHGAIMAIGDFVVIAEEEIL
nr:hypothetical protein [Nanoarchaeum sp.]